MFETKNQEISCPKCHRKEVCFDSKTGFYCKACGQKFTSEEAEVLVENEVFQTGTENSS